MPKKLIEYQLKNNGTLLVEVALDDLEGFGRAGIGDNVIPKIKKNFDDILRSVPKIAASILDDIKELPKPPKEIDLEIGVKIGAKGELIIAGGTAEANCTIKFKWEIT